MPSRTVTTGAVFAVVVRRAWIGMCASGLAAVVLALLAPTARASSTIDTLTPWQAAGSHVYSEHCFGGCSAGNQGGQTNSIGEVFTAPSGSDDQELQRISVVWGGLNPGLGFQPSTVKAIVVRWNPVTQEPEPASQARYLSPDMHTSGDTPHEFDFDLTTGPQTGGVALTGGQEYALVLTSDASAQPSSSNGWDPALLSSAQPLPGLFAAVPPPPDTSAANWSNGAWCEVQDATSRCGTEAGNGAGYGNLPVRLVFGGTGVSPGVQKAKAFVDEGATSLNHNGNIAAGVGLVLSKTPAAPVGLTISGIGIVMKIAADQLGGVAFRDPPDPAFRSLTRAHPLPLPRLHPKGALTARAIRALDPVFRADLLASADVNAMLVSFDREGSARAAGDTTWTRKQRSAAGHFALSAAAQLDRAVRLGRTATRTLRRTSVARRFAISASQIRALQTSVRRHGLPTAIRSLARGLHAAGQLTAAVLGLKPRAISISLSSLLSGPSVLKAERLAATNLRVLAREEFGVS